MIQNGTRHIAKLTVAGDPYVVVSSELCHLIVTLRDAELRPYALALWHP